MPTIPEHLIGEQCKRCGYRFRKNDRVIYGHGVDHLACENEKGCRRRQRKPRPEYANPDATFDEMIERVAAELSAYTERMMLGASENEDYLRALYRATYSSRPLLRENW